MENVEITKTVLITLPIDLEQVLRALAQREKRSRNAQINWILEDWVRQAQSAADLAHEVSGIARTEQKDSEL